MGASQDVLADNFARWMMEGAVLVIEQRAVKLTDAQTDALVIALKERAGPALDEAIRDSKVAFDARMDRWAVATAKASAVKAGVMAAVKVLGE